MPVGARFGAGVGEYCGVRNGFDLTVRCHKRQGGGLHACTEAKSSHLCNHVLALVCQRLVRVAAFVVKYFKKVSRTLLKSAFGSWP